MAEAPPQQRGRSPLEMPFPFYLAVTRGGYQDMVERVRRCRRVDGFGLVYFEQLPEYTAALPYHWQQYPDAMNEFLQSELVSKGTKRQMERASIINWSSGLCKLEPLLTTGDGNCLLHAAALYMWGIEDTELILRSSLSESLNHGSFAATHMKRWQQERSSADQAHMPDFRYNTMEWENEFDMIKSMADPNPSPGSDDLPYHSLEEFHIYTLANILRRPIMVLAHDRVRNARGASLQPLSVSGLYLPLHWDPDLCCKSPIVLGFEDNHFFPLMHTIPEEAKYGGDLLVPLVVNTPHRTGGGTTGFMTVHFSDLPQKSHEELARHYLDVDTVIHCVSDKETAIGLPGAKLGTKSLGKGFSVWDAYFGLAEKNLRAYYETEYNPSGASEEREPRVGAMEPPASSIPTLPDASRPPNRSQGQCKTQGCPFQRSIATGELCVECFRKGQRSKCHSDDCMNKEDVGLAGFCKVCHEANKFQQESGLLSQNDIHNESGSSDGSSPTNGHVRENDLTSLTVNTINAGLAKCIIPECQLTGNPKTGDMCSDCYAKNVELQNEIADAMNPVSAEREAEDFVVVSSKGEEEAISSNSEELRDRRAALLSKLGMEEGTRRKTPTDDRSKSAFTISGNKGLYPATESPSGVSSHISGRSQSASIGAGQLNLQAQGTDPAVGRAQSHGYNPARKITVQKDLCATPGCPGVRLRERDLCKSCMDRKRQPDIDEHPVVNPALHPAQQVHPPSRHGPSHGGMYGSAPMPRREPFPVAQGPPRRVDQVGSGGREAEIRQQHYGQVPRQQVQEPFPVAQGPPRGVDRVGSGGREAEIKQQHYGQVPRQQAGHYQEEKRCRIRRCGQPAAPPDYKYCLECLQDIDEDYISQKAAQLLQEREYDTTRSAPPRPPQGIHHEPAVRQKVPAGRVPVRRDQANVDITQDLERQLREQYRHDRSDAQPAAPPLRNFAAPVVKRGPCQRPGGCPDHMYGSSETGGMCSKCWKEVGAKQPEPARGDRHGSAEEFRGTPTHNAAVPQNPLVREGYYQQPRGRDGGYQNYGTQVTQNDPLYQEIDQRCAQPECTRPAAENVEKFCEQCHANYVALFEGFRQINTP